MTRFFNCRILTYLFWLVVARKFSAGMFSSWFLHIFAYYLRLTRIPAAPDTTPQVFTLFKYFVNLCALQNTTHQPTTRKNNCIPLHSVKPLKESLHQQNQNGTEKLGRARVQTDTRNSCESTEQNRNHRIIFQICDFGSFKNWMVHEAVDNLGHGHHQQKHSQFRNAPTNNGLLQNFVIWFEDFVPSRQATTTLFHLPLSEIPDTGWFSPPQQHGWYQTDLVI